LPGNEQRRKPLWVLGRSLGAVGKYEVKTEGKFTGRLSMADNYGNGGVRGGGLK
jgi:hypothetical protein